MSYDATLGAAFLGNITAAMRVHICYLSFCSNIERLTGFTEYHASRCSHTTGIFGMIVSF